jgi:tRNA A37 methylthiotransferase MiaB
MLRRIARFRDYTLLVTGCMPAVQAESIRKVCNPVFFDPASIREYYRQVNTVSGNEPGIVQVAEG